VSRRPPSQGDADWTAMLRARPVRNSAVRVVENAPAGATVYVRRRRPAWFVPPVSWIVPYKPEQQIVLDGIGRHLWLDCDGRRTVEEIVDRFKDEQRLTFHEARAAVTGYLEKLIQRGVLAIMVRDGA
jgi:hypothetical protein